MRAYQDRPAYVKEERRATVEVRVDEEALEAAVRRLGWRIYSTNQPAEQLSLEQAGWPIAMNIWWSAVWGDLKVARCH